MYRIIFKRLTLSFIKIQYLIKVALQPKINKCNFWHFNLLFDSVMSHCILQIWLRHTQLIMYLGIYIPQNELMYF